MSHPSSAHEPARRKFLTGAALAATGAAALGFLPEFLYGK